MSTSGEPKKGGWTLRLGRQEFEFGAGHYLSASEVFNVRRSFDGARVIGQAGSWTFNALAARPAEVNAGIFDDSPDHTQTVWATGIFGPHPVIPKTNLSVYVIGFDRKLGRFDHGAGPRDAQDLRLPHLGQGEWLRLQLRSPLPVGRLRPW